MPEHVVINIMWGFGGLALFLYGMLLVSDGLKQASGPGFRRLIAAISSSRLRSYILGVTMGTTVQSSASTVMVVSLLNAGLLTLVGAIPLIAGANLGTSLAMQFISLDISWLWSALAILGVLLRLLPLGYKQQRVGQALMGLSLLFLGMRLMSQSVFPMREILSDWLAVHNGEDWPSFLIAFAGALLFTCVIQSSGATMGILFSLSTAGVFANIHQVMPIILGAQIGTCITALLSSIGTNSEARRGAIAHLYFNIFGACLAVMLMPWLMNAVIMLNGSLTRQIANCHTIIMITTGLVIVPLSVFFVRFLTATTPFKQRKQEMTYLHESLLDRPEEAIAACRKELGRITRIVRRGFALNRSLVQKPDRRIYNLIKQTEESVDQIYRTARRFLIHLATHIKDPAKAAQIQWYNLCLIYLERISDHNDNLSDLTFDMKKRVNSKDVPYVRELCDGLFSTIEPILEGVETAWLVVDKENKEHAQVIREHRASYLPESEQSQLDIVARISDNQIDAVTGFILTEYISELDRIVRHTKKIAGILEKSDKTSEQALQPY